MFTQSRQTQTQPVPIPTPSVMEFGALGLRAALGLALRNRFGVVSPTRVQQASIPVLAKNLQRALLQSKAGKDPIVVHAETGTGKTLAYLTPAIDILALSNHSRGAVCLIVVPSLTLAAQVTHVATSIIDELRQPTTTPTPSGTSQVSERKVRCSVAALFLDPSRPDKIATALSSNIPTIVVGTPSCIVPLIKGNPLSTSRHSTLRGIIDPKRVCAIVVDEADHVLKPPSRYAPRSVAPKKTAFLIDTIRMVCESRTDSHPLLAFVSATVNNPLRFMLKTLSKDHKLTVISTRDPVTTLPTTLSHRILVHPPAANMWAVANVLSKVMRLDEFQNSLVVMNPGDSLIDLVNALNEYQISSHIVQSDTPTNVPSFSPTCRVFLVTLPLVRGLDIPHISHVYCVADVSDTTWYTHVAGRTARAGRAGTMTSIVTAETKPHRELLIKRLGVPVKEIQLETENQPK